ncbi:MAG: hypothetical protein ABIQ93_11990, partial [Saprospiraceae bacterium]
MKKPIASILSLAVLGLFSWQCGQNPPASSRANAAPETAVAVANVQRITHEEAADTLRVDTNAALRTLNYKKLSPMAAKAVLSQYPIADMVVNNSPDNGFYGDNRYRIEFIVTTMATMSDNPLQYRVKGKNRYKKTISAFEGILDIRSVGEFSDPNLKETSLEYGDINFGKAYALQGKFNFKEDSSMSSSGQFAGDFSMEFYTPGAAAPGEEASEEGAQLWFFSNNSPSEGSGYRFVGNWTSFKNPGMQKPVIWARDIFRFANNIL